MRAGPSGRLADKFKSVGPDGLVSPGTILSDGDCTINMQVRLKGGNTQHMRMCVADNDFVCLCVYMWTCVGCTPHV